MPCLRWTGKVVHGGSRRSYFSMGALLDFCSCYLSTREGQRPGAWELLQVFVLCSIPVLAARTELLVKCFHACRFLMFSVYRTARGRSELIPCISLKNHLTRFNILFNLVRGVCLIRDCSCCAWPSHPLPFWFKGLRGTRELMRVCSRDAAARRRRGVLASAAYAMRKARRGGIVSESSLASPAFAASPRDTLPELGGKRRRRRMPRCALPLSRRV